MDGLYYLHTNGRLIYKVVDPGDLDESPFVSAYWFIDLKDRGTAWKIVLESCALGVHKEEVMSLATRWKCDVKDLTEYLCRNLNPTYEEKVGLEVFLSYLGLRSDSYFELLSNSKIGDPIDYDKIEKISEVDVLIKSALPEQKI